MKLVISSQGLHPANYFALLLPSFVSSIESYVRKWPPACPPMPTMWSWCTNS